MIVKRTDNTRRQPLIKEENVDFRMRGRRFLLLVF